MLYKTLRGHLLQVNVFTWKRQISLTTYQWISLPTELFLHGEGASSRLLHQVLYNIGKHRQTSLTCLVVRRGSICLPFGMSCSVKGIPCCGDRVECKCNLFSSNCKVSKTHFIYKIYELVDIYSKVLVLNLNWVVLHFIYSFIWKWMNQKWIVCFANILIIHTEQVSQAGCRDCL